MILSDLLPQFMPQAIEWVKAQEKYILSKGKSLTTDERQIAQRVGVGSPEKIRVLVVKAVPTPEEPMLKYMCEYTGMLGPDTIGLTLQYGIFIREGEENDMHLLAHECRHVAQYEEHGSIASFLGVYLEQILEYGYEAAPLEIDAREKAWKAMSG